MAKAWQELAKDPSSWADVKYDDSRLDEFAHAVEDRYHIPRGVVESLKNAGERSHRDKDGGYQVSWAGAEGLMQFMPGTRKDYQHDTNNPFASIDAAGRYIADLGKHYKGNYVAAVAHYNGGSHAGDAIVAGRAPPKPETQEYVKRIKAYMMKRYGGNEVQSQVAAAVADPPNNSGSGEM